MSLPKTPAPARPIRLLGTIPPPPSKPQRRKPVRRPLPKHLPRETVIHQPACTCPGCGGTTFSRIGQDEREVLEYVPSSFKVICHMRPKLSCRSCETIVQAPMPTLPIERGRPGPGLVAHVLVSKYSDHTPLHRQTVIYAREGVELDRATLADWVGQAEFLLSPLAEAIGRHIRAGSVLHADDTTVPVLAPGEGKTRTGRLWVVLRDERPWGSDVPPAAFYLYAPDRKKSASRRCGNGCWRKDCGSIATTTPRISRDDGVSVWANGCRSTVPNTAGSWTAARCAPCWRSSTTRPAG